MIKFNALILLLCIQLTVFSQSLSIPLTQGGVNGGGTMLNVKLNGNYVATSMLGITEASETNISQSEPNDFVPNGLHYEATNNVLYISIKSGARLPFNAATGSIFKYNLTTDTSELVVNFHNELGEYPLGSPVKLGNKLYGVTASGGTNDLGVIFSIDLTTDQFEVVYNFDGVNGGLPTCPLYVKNNLLYGSTKTNGPNSFTIFSFDPNTSAHSVLYSDNVLLTRTTTGMMIRNNRLYYARGASIYYIDLTNLGAGETSFYLGFGANQAIGSEATDFTIGLDGSWYTCFNKGGDPNLITNYGSIAKMDFGNSTMIKLHGFQGASLGQNTIVKLIPGGLSSELYGVAGNDSGSSVLFKITTSGSYTVLKEFNVANEGLLVNAQLILANNKLYGVAQDKGAYNAGTIWSFDLSSQNFVVESTLGFENGKSPFAEISENPNNNSLNFITHQGTSSNKGGYLTYDMSTGVYTKTVNIESSYFTKLLSRPIYSGNKTFFIGDFDQGAIASENSFAGLIEFDESTGERVTITGIAPNPNVLEQIKTKSNSNYVQDGTDLFGASLGFIWKFDLTSNTYSTLHTFNNLVDQDSRHSILKIGGLLYGSYKEDASGDAVFYSLDLGTNTFTELVRENGHTYGGFVNDGSIIYGIKEGNATHFDTLVSYDIVSSSSFTNHVEIDSATLGISFDGTLTLVNGDVYGVVNNGGSNGKGGIFKFTPDSNPNNSVIASLLSFDNSTGFGAVFSKLYYSTSSVGIEHFEIAHSINVYPNPVTDLLTIDYDKVTSIEIYSMSGQLLLNNLNTNQIDVKTLDSGVYIVKFEINNELFTSKIIKH